MTLTLHHFIKPKPPYGWLQSAKGEQLIPKRMTKLTPNLYNKTQTTIQTIDLSKNLLDDYMLDKSNLLDGSHDRQIQILEVRSVAHYTPELGNSYAL